MILDTEVLKEILGCVKSIHNLLKHRRPALESPVNKKRFRLTNNPLDNPTTEVFIKVPNYEDEQFEDASFLEEEIPIDAAKLENEEEIEESSVLNSHFLTFPLKTAEEVDILEAYLLDPKSPYRRKIIDLMVGTGFENKDYKFAIRTFFRVVFETALMAKYCWYGTDTKSSLKNLKNTLEFFESTVRKWAPKWKKNDFALVVRNYIRNCPARAAKISN